MEEDMSKSLEELCVGVERFTVREAIDKVKNEAMMNVDIIESIVNLTLRQKLLLAYFYGTREGVPTILDFRDVRK